MTPATIHTANSDPTAIRPGDYVPDPLHSHVLFEVSHFGLSTYIGEFTELTGTLRLDPGRFADARLKTAIPIASVRTSSSVLDDELKGPRWLATCWRRVPPSSWLSPGHRTIAFHANAGWTERMSEHRRILADLGTGILGQPLSGPSRSREACPP
jgi:hypothetical protein